MALVTLKRYAEIVTWKDKIQPLGASPGELFDAANCAFAVAMAAIVFKDKALALVHLHAAHLLASALKMEYRIQHVVLEMQRLRNSIGQPDPEGIQAAMALAPMNERRTRFACSVLAEAYLALGDYVTARQVAPAGSGLATFAAALIGEHVPAQQQDDYARLASILMEKDSSSFFTPEYEPELTYAQIIRASRLLHSDARPQAGAVLASIYPTTPDQQVLWALLVLAAQADGVRVTVPPTKVMEILRTGMATIATPLGLRSLLQQHGPRAMLLLGFMPGAPAPFAGNIPEIPLLVGNAVLWKGRGYPLPGATGGRNLVREIQGKRPLVGHSMEKLRFDRAWDAIQMGEQQPVSIAWLMKALAWAARGEPTQQHLWKPALLTLCDLARGEGLSTALAALM